MIRHRQGGNGGMIEKRDLSFPQGLRDLFTGR
jgi:hypothetical protein